MISDYVSAPGFMLQEKPSIFCAMLQGNWLLEHTTPSWRIKDPIQGFQRIVREVRAREIAMAVLDQHRTFPNAIILATDIESIDTSDNQILIPEDAKFLIVDGQHRLWAQHFSTFEASYACLIHTGLTEGGMATLFLEINDNQRRVPSSLRWDLVRLVRPDNDPEAIAASEMVNLLATEKNSPFYQRIDLTGEQSEIQIKQGSIAPELKSLLSRRSPIYKHLFLEQYRIVLEYSTAISQIDADAWGRPESVFFKARVLRALFKLLSDIAKGADPARLTVSGFLPYLQKINREALDPEAIRSAQGSAGIKAIYLQIKAQVFPGS